MASSLPDQIEFHYIWSDEREFTVLQIWKLCYEESHPLPPKHIGVTVWKYLNK